MQHGFHRICLRTFIFLFQKKNTAKCKIAPFLLLVNSSSLSKLCRGWCGLCTFVSFILSASLSIEYYVMFLVYFNAGDRFVCNNQPRNIVYIKVFIIPWCQCLDYNPSHLYIPMSFVHLSISLYYSILYHTGSCKWNVYKLVCSC